MSKVSLETMTDYKLTTAKEKTELKKLEKERLAEMDERSRKRRATKAPVAKPVSGTVKPFKTFTFHGGDDDFSFSERDYNYLKNTLDGLDIKYSFPGAKKVTNTKNGNVSYEFNQFNILNSISDTESEVLKPILT